MRRITLWIASTVSALVLLFSYHTSTDATAATSVVAQGANGGSGSTATSGSSGTTGSSSGSASTGSTDTSTGSTGTGSTGSSGSSSSSGATESSGTKTYSGDAVGTRYGDVQVEITVTDGKVTAAQVLQVPWKNHKDQAINGRAVPVLNEEAVSAQGADIDMVSGATYTSEAYIGSLQSALDQANL